jgi:hypothetical protein
MEGEILSQFSSDINLTLPNGRVVLMNGAHANGQFHQPFSDADLQSHADRDKILASLTEYHSGHFHVPFTTAEMEAHPDRDRILATINMTTKHRRYL